MPLPLMSEYVQVIVAAPVQLATAVAPVPSGARWYWRRTSFAAAGAEKVIENETPRGNWFCAWSETTLMGCCARAAP